MKLLIAILCLTLPLAAQTSQQESNKALVLNFWREVLEPHHVELASKYLTPGYIQHNPNVPTGLDGFVSVLKTLPPMPIRPTLRTPPIQVFAKDDLVVLVFDREAADPKDRSKKYHYNSFDMFRVTDGKISEHWDSAKKQ